MTLLDRVRSLVEAERGLTDAIEASLPLLSHHDGNASSVILSSTQQSAPPLLPTPRNMDEVPTILAVARAYSLRTSAPPTWNPNLPVIGFATPNPLPHQLRGGALGAMQLKMAREEKNRKGREVADRRERERRRVEEDKRKSEAKKEEGNAMDVDKDEGASGKRKREEENPIIIDPKKREATEHQNLKVAPAQPAAAAPNKRQTTEEYKKKKEAANMNLSESSSSEESSDDDGESD